MQRIILLCSLFFTAAVFALSTPSQWQGRPAQSLLQQWGTPASVTTTSSGNTVYVYTFKRLKSNPPAATANPSIIVGPNGKAVAASIPQTGMPTLTTCTWRFEVNRQGMIVGVGLEGNC